MQRINCAVYVRKSTEKGLDQEFNSLHNQEEACRNYILSQAYNGWEFYRTYSDGGISGGTMKRPGLEEMLGDVRKGLIQNIVVYKIDRFSRSIIDFHNMMRELEKHGCSFVSITQAFDTSTSMGKLTLNMLLSFAQFEREVSGERIRDKKAASKRKGMWMGGCPPLGYDVLNKKLVPNKEEAGQVKLIFEKYLEMGSISGLKEYLADMGILGKKWTCNNGLDRGGHLLTRSMIARILRSEIYIGMIEDKTGKESWPGLHKAIIDRKLFDQVQALLDENRNKDSEAYEMDAYLLSRKLFDADGNPFKNQKSSKHKMRKYRYYALKKQYLPAGDLDEITVGLVRKLLDSPLKGLLDEPTALEFKSIDFDALSPRRQSDLIRAMLDKLVFHENRLTFFIHLDDLAYLRPFKKESFLNTNALPIDEGNEDVRLYQSKDSRHLVIEKEICINNRHFSNLYVGKGKKFITVTENCNNLIKALSFGRRYGKMHRDGMSLMDIGKMEHKRDRTIYRYVCLNYLSPNIVNDIFDGQVPTHINLQVLFDIASRYPDFNDQETHFRSGQVRRLNL